MFACSLVFLFWICIIILENANKHSEVDKMIVQLHIMNVGIIDDITINFEEGLNVLTGETGARKELNNRLFKCNYWI